MGIRKRRRQARHGVRLEFRVGVGENEDLRARRPNEVVDDRGFSAAAVELLDPDPSVPRGASALRGGVAATVAADRDRETPDVLLREQVPDPGADRRLFVVGGDHDLDRWKGRRGIDRPNGNTSREAREKGGISPVRPGDEEERESRETGRRSGQRRVSARRRSSREKDRPMESQP